MKYLQILKSFTKIFKKMELQTTEVSKKSIIEGQAEIRLTSNKVFYNQVQEFNRDLSISVINVFIDEFRKEKNAEIQKNIRVKDFEKEPITILEALSATGLRSIRYAKEISNVSKVIANDLSAQAVQTIKDNVIYNGVENVVEISHDDACMVMYKHKHPDKRFTFVDLDPYGCPAIFLDSAVQSVQDGGMLLVTATDMAILAGNTPETCFYKYGAVSLKVRCCHEMALRILLQCIEKHANRYGRYTEPMLSISVDFYIRVFVKIKTGPIHCKKTSSKVSMVYHCTGCDNITLQPLGAFKPNPTTTNANQKKAYLPAVPPVGGKCVNCNQNHHMGGPIWTAPIHNKEFVDNLLQFVTDNNAKFATAKRLHGVLSMVQEELQDVPLYYIIDKLFGRVHMETMPMLIMRSAILNAGYRVSFSHAAKLSIKTDAPADFMWDVVRTWNKTHPVKTAKIETDPVTKYILEREVKHNVDLTERPDANPESRRSGSLRFQYNPAPHWGPGSRAQLNVGDNKIDKAARNQNKNANKRKGLKREHSPETVEKNKPHTEIESKINE